MVLKRFTALSVLSISLIYATSSASAQDASIASDKLAVDVGLSTFGLSVAPSYQINDNFGVRALMGYFSLSEDFEEDGEEFKGTGTLAGVAVLADYYPSKNYGFRISGGLALPLYSVKGTSQGSTFETEGNSYAISDVELSLHSTGVAPMLSTGYDFRNRKSGWSGSIDIGVLAGVQYDSSFDYSAVGLSASDRAQLERDVTESQKEIVDALSDELSILPFASISATYRF